MLVQNVKNFLFLSLFVKMHLKIFLKGFKFYSGQSFGENSIDCETSKEYCYNMTADGGGLLSLSKAGCSFYRCLVSC